MDPPGELNSAPLDPLAELRGREREESGRGEREGGGRGGRGKKESGGPPMSESALTPMTVYMVMVAY